MIEFDLTTRVEIDRPRAALAGHADDPRTVMGTPRYMQVGGRKEAQMS